MSIIKPGQRYRIANEENGLVIDLAGHKITEGENGMVWEGGRMNKSIVGWHFHGEDNQQWITEQQDDGQWTIRSISHQKYVAFENAPDNGTALVGVDKPQLWDIEFLPESEDHDNPRVKYILSRTPLAMIQAPDVEFL
ncbi:hypothetical protein EI94DRAFT_1738236 [Lactarius quietus]|nr:hypothetical protein EI94DRAFT_1738236 [Lactarius quietus]